VIETVFAVVFSVVAGVLGVVGLLFMWALVKAEGPGGDS